jgi:hypothetical protein
LPLFLKLCYSSLLPLFLYTSVLTPVQITSLVSATKHALFPNGYLAPSPQDPTPEEQAVLRSELLRRLTQAIPGSRVKHSFYYVVLSNEYNFWGFAGPLAPLLLGPARATRERTLSALLDPFDEQACNAHLFMLLFDLVLLALFPEMTVGTTDSGVGT